MQAGGRPGSTAMGQAVGNESLSVSLVWKDKMHLYLSKLQAWGSRPFVFVRESTPTGIKGNQFIAGCPE